MKREHYTGESHNKHGGADGTEPMRISGKMCGSPIDEGGHPSTLDAYCECYQNRGCAGLAKKVHAQVIADRPRWRPSQLRCAQRLRVTVCRAQRSFQTHYAGS